MRYLTSLLLAFLAFGAQAQNVTFQVDMSEYNEAYAYGTVHVNGSFNGWCGDCNPLTDQGNGIWSATLPLTAGTIEYKFTLDGWNYQEELAGIAGIGACTSTLGGFTNRTLTFDADVVLPAVCWESCAACGEVVELPTYELTFNVNMQNEDVSPDGLFLAGGLAFGEGWNVPAQELLDADGDDIYSVTLLVDSGFSSDYTFVNGIGWGNKENIAGQDCAVAPYNDRRLDPMSGPETVSTCFAVCSTDGSCPVGAGCTDGDAANYDASATTDDGSCQYNVTFAVDMSNYAASGEVFTTPEINGSFNGWCGGCNPLSDPEGDNIWTTTLPLPVGTHEYQFAVDSWADQEFGLDPNAACTLGANRFVEVIDMPVDQGQVCWELCTPCTAGAGCTDSDATNFDSAATSDDGSCTYEVIFTVDMNQYGVAGVDYTTPEVNGSFNGWCGGCAPMADPESDGIWTTTIVLGAGTWEYQFAIDSWTDQEFGLDPAAPCTLGANRFVEVIDAPVDQGQVCWESCEACVVAAPGCTDSEASNYDSAATDDDGSCTYAVTFNVDMNCEDAASFVTPAVESGAFGWCGGCIPMTDADMDGVWSVTLDLPLGSFEYKYAVDSFAGQEDLIDDALAGASCVGNTDGATFANRVIVVDGADSSISDTYGSCDACVPGSGGCTDLLANNYDASATEDDGSCTYDITFNVDMSCEDPASFSTPSVESPEFGWCGGCVAMTDTDGDGIWSITLSLDAGDFEYKYAIDQFAGQENLVDDMVAGASCAPITDFAGYANRIVTAGPGVSTNDTYGSCSACLPGCTDSSACNYDESANSDDGSCSLPDLNCQVCIDGVATDVDSDGDGVRDCEEIVGCQDEGACNYDATATDAGSCDLPDALTGCGDTCLDGGVLYEFIMTDSYGDGQDFGDGYALIVDGQEIASGSGSSFDDVVEHRFCAAQGACVQLQIVADGFYAYENAFSLTADGVEIAGGAATSTTYYLGGCMPGCTDSSSCNYDSMANVDDGSCLQLDACGVCGGAGVDTDGDGVCDSAEIAGCQDADACNYNPAATDGPMGSISIDWALGGFASEVSWNIGETSIGGSVSDTDGDVYTLSPGSYTVNAIDSYGDGWNGHELTITDMVSGTSYLIVNTSEASAFEAVSFEIEVTAEGECTYPSQAYLDCNEECINDADGDGVCDEIEVEGCVVATACNYNPNATDLVACIYPGCMDPLACNYDASAGCDDGSCAMLDAVGVCGGDCEADDDGDGVCNNLEVDGCTDVLACNYDLDATELDDSCEYCSCALDGDGGENGFGLAVEQHAVNGIDGLITYRLYVTTPGPTDFVSAVAGDNENPSYLRTSTSFYQDENGSLTAGGINPFFFSVAPGLQYDSWLTIGIDQSPGEGDGTSDVTLAQAAGDTWAADFEAGGNLELNSFFGGSWFTTNLVSNGIAGDDNRVLVAQLTTDGTLTGQLYVQVFPGGDGEAAQYLTLSFGAPSCGCTDDSIAFDGVSYAACNYNPSATYDDGSCTYAAAANLDCDGVCFNDADGDGVCDEDEILGCQDGSLDALGGYNACNYNPLATDADTCLYVEPVFCPLDGEHYVFTNCDGVIFPEFDADMNGVVDCFDQGGCMNPLACNYEADLTFDDGTCDFGDDTNGNGICDLLEGCLYEDACNYSADVIAFAAEQLGRVALDDESCDFSCLTTGCSDEDAINYDQYADGSDNSGCLFIGCQDETALNFDASANYPGECVYLDPCPGDFTGDGEVDVNDLLDFFQLWGNVCPWIVD